MLSSRWRELREAALARDEHRCRGCDGSEGLQVHHRWYPAVLGDEDVGDLTTLCATCHRAVHDSIAGRRRPIFGGSDGWLPLLFLLRGRRRLFRF